MGRGLGTVRHVRRGTFAVLGEHFLNNAGSTLSKDVRRGQRAAFFPPRPYGEWNKVKDVLSPSAAIVVESGGRAEIRPELYAYRCFYVPAAEARIETVCRIGGTLAVRFGGSSLFRQAAEVLRQSA